MGKGHIPALKLSPTRPPRCRSHGRLRLRPHQAPGLACHRQAAHPPCCMAPVGLHTEPVWGSALPEDGRAPPPAPPQQQQQKCNKTPKHGIKQDCPLQVGVPLQQAFKMAAWPRASARSFLVMEGHPHPHCPPNGLLGKTPVPEGTSTCYGFNPREAQGDGGHWLHRSPRSSPPFPAFSSGGGGHPPHCLHEPGMGIPTPGLPWHPSPSAAPRRRRSIPTNQFDSAQQEQLQF